MLSRSSTALKRVVPGLSRQISATAVRCDDEDFRVEPHSAGSLIDMGTRRIFNEDHDMFRSTCRQFFEEEVMPHHAQWEEDGQVSRECWLKAGELGMLGVMTPEKYGGLGLDVLYSAIVWEEQSYTLCTGPGFALHSEIVVPYIYNYGTEDQKERLLPKLISGEFIGAIAMTEPGAGSDLQGIRTTASPNGDDDWLLNGSKTFITNGAMADVVIVVCKTDPSSKAAHGTSLAIVETGMEGFTKGKKLKKMGMKAQDTSELFFEDVKLNTTEHILGGAAGLNKGFYQLMHELPQERLLIADMAIAAAEGAFEITREYVKERKAFGKSIADFQLTKHKMAEMKTELAVGRAFTDQCLELHAQGKLTSGGASMAKYWCTDLQNKVLDHCVQLHGGWGYMWEYAVCRGYADARVQTIYGGSNEIMKELIAREI
jgi:long-chain-acyl-CoA dehydrogenase